MTVIAQSKKPAWGPRPRLRVLPAFDDSSARPLTATLDHPLILNAALLSKLDMTAFTREGLLAVSRLCSVPIITQATRRKINLTKKTAKSMDADRSTNEVTSQRKPLKEAKKGKAATGIKVEDVFGSTMPLPEACRACGRREQPERLHSHPMGSLVTAKTQGPTAKPIVRTPITKPVAANFKSVAKESSNNKSSSKLPQEVGRKPLKDDGRPRSGRPRTLTCYICSREFGTASLPLHEPKCQQKWERENQQLPPSLRRTLPEKPALDQSTQDWNDFAWQASQATLVPCHGCGRTFQPDRLVVHTRSCKHTADSSRPTSSPQSIATPPTVPCYICGREFGTRSISIHEPQCLRKWRVENSNLPQALQRPEPQKPDFDLARITGCYICGTQIPVRERLAHERACLQDWRRANSARPEGERQREPQRPDYRFTETGEVDFSGTWHSIWANHMDSLIPCRHCGRKFFADRIERHENACTNVHVKSKTTR